MELATDVLERCTRIFGRGASGHPGRRDQPDQYPAHGRPDQSGTQAGRRDRGALSQIYGPDIRTTTASWQPGPAPAGGGRPGTSSAGTIRRWRASTEAWPDHHYSLTVATNLASDLAALGDPAGARELGEDTLPRLWALMDEDHPLTLGCAANLQLGSRAEATRPRPGWTKGCAASPTHWGDIPTQSRPRSGRLDFDFDPPPIFTAWPGHAGTGPLAACQRVKCCAAAPSASS